MRAILCWSMIVSCLFHCSVLFRCPTTPYGPISGGQVNQRKVVVQVIKEN
jgi:hypothetical protein